MTWRVNVTFGVGGGEVTYTADQPADPTAARTPTTGPALVSVRMTESLEPGEGIWPTKRSRETCQVVMFYETAAEAAAEVADGTRVRCEFVPDTSMVVESQVFDGIASDPTMEPHPLGVLLTVVVADRRAAELDPETVGTVAYPAEDHHTRIDRMLDEVDPGSTRWVFTTPTHDDTMDLVARPVGGTSFGAEVERLLSFALYHRTASQDWRFTELVPGDPGVYVLQMVPTVPVSPAPLTMDGTTGEVVADPDGDTRPYVIDANVVSFGGTWSRILGGTVDTVEVYRQDGSFLRATWQPGVATRPRVTRRLETDLEDLSDVGTTALLFLPGFWDTADAAAWEVDEFTCHLNTADGWYPRPLRNVMAVGDLQARHTPTGRSWYVGTVGFREVEVTPDGTDDRATVKVRLVATSSTNGIFTATVDDLSMPIDALTEVTIDELAHVRVV